MAVNVAGGELAFQATIDASQFRAQLNRIESDIKSFSGGIQKQSEHINTFAKRATAAAAGFFSTQAAGQFIQSMVQVRGEFQKIEVAYRTMLGSKEAADKLMAETVKLAALTPFTLQDVAQGSKQLLAYGFAADTVTDNLQMLGDVAAGVGAPLADITYLYGTLQTQGRAYTRDIMQFTQRGIPILDELAKVLKTNKENVLSMVEAGKVGFPEVEKAFQNLTGAGGKFFNLMAQQSQTLTGQLSNLSDAWQRMLNDIGQSQEGLISTVIQGGIKMIDNYEQVFEIIKSLIVIYGAYRAALIAEAALMQLHTARVAGLSTSYVMLAAAETAAAAAGRVLNAVMAASPLIAFTGAIAGMVFAVSALTENTDGWKKATQAATKATDDATDAAVKEQAQINVLTSVIDSKTATLQQQENAYKKLQGITGGYLESMTLEQFKLDKSRQKLQEYIEELKKATKARVLFAQYQGKLAELEKLNINGVKEIGMFERAKATFRNFWGSKDWLNTNSKAVDKKILEEKKKSVSDEIKGLEKEIGDRFNALASEVEDGTKKTENAVVTGTEKTLAGMKKKLAELKESKDAAIAGGKEYLSIKKEIDKLEAKIASYEGGSGKTKSARAEAIKSQEQAAKATEDLKQKQLDFLQKLDEEENRILLARMERNAREIEENRQKYEQMRRDAKELGLGTGVVERINRAEETTTGTIQYQQETENLKEEVEKQKQIFDEFEKYRRNRGREEAELRFGDQKKGFADYTQYLENEVKKTEQSSYELSIGLMPPEEVQQRLLYLKKALEDAKKAARIAKEEEFNEANEISQTYEQKRLEIVQRYAEMEAALRNDPRTEDFEGQKAELLRQRDDELKILEDTAYQKTEIYRLLNEDIYFYTVERLKQEAALLEEMLKNDHTLTVAQRKEIQERIAMLRQLALEGSKTFQAMVKASEGLSEIAGSFGELANALEQVAPALAETLDTMNKLATAGANAAASVASFMSGNIIGGITRGIRAIAGIINIFKGAKESARKAREEIERINFRNFLAEFDINEIFRERVRMQIRLNELRISGIRKESELLKEQAINIQKDYNRVLTELYKQVAIVGQRTEKYGGFLGIGRKTRIVNLTETLAGKSYADLEKLFLSGKLEGKAKELFQTLQRLKQEGADIDQMLIDNQKEAMELFTGTTADSLLDSIVEGFRAGKSAIADFADDFELLMQNAVINALKYQVLEQPLQEFYKAFADASKSGDELTESEMKQLKDQFDMIIAAAGTRFDQLKKIAGVDFDKLVEEEKKDEPERSGVAGAFAAASGEQIDALTGQFNGQRMATLELVQISKSGRDIMVQSLAVQSQIEANTRRAAEYLRAVVISQEAHTIHLQSIDRKTGSTTATLQANGIGS